MGGSHFTFNGIEDVNTHSRFGFFSATWILSMTCLGWSPTSGRRMSGTSRPSLGCGFCPLLLHFPSISLFKISLGMHLEVPDILLPDVDDQPILVLVIGCLVAPYRTISRYYRCDAPYCAILFQEG